MISDLLVIVVAFLQFVFMVLEMFYWNKPLGLKVFRLNQKFADESAVLAANQGLYNGFLSAGLIWGLVISDPSHALSVKLFFLSCVFIAGSYGAATASRSILFIQALPAFIALLLCFKDTV